MPVDSNSRATTASLPPTQRSSHARKQIDPAEQKFIQEIYLIGFLVLVTVLVFGQVVWHPFIDFDDNLYVFANSNVREGLSLKNIIWAFTTFDMGHWHPLTWLSLIIDRQLFGMRAGGYHFTNLLLHIISTLLLFKFLRRATDTLYPSAAIALLFAIHPLHVEPVAWIASRKDVLSGCFFMLTLHTYYHYTQDSKSWKKYLLVYLMLILGLMSKSMLITLPFLLLLLDYWPLNRYQQVIDQGYRAILNSFWRLLLEKLPMFILAFATAFVAYLADTKLRLQLATARQTEVQIAEQYTDTSSTTIRRAIYSFTHYIGKLFWPTDLGIYYSTEKIALLLVILSIITVILVTIIVMLRWRRSPYLLVGWCWYLGTIAPVAKLLLADRYTYLSYIGLFIMIVWFVKDDLSNWRYQQTMIKWVGIPALVLLSLCSLVQADYWQDSVAIFQHTLAVTKDNNKIHMLLAQSYFRTNKFDEATKEYQEVLRLKPQFAEIHYNLGQIKLKQGRVDEAINHFYDSLKINPKLAKSHYSLGGILSKQGKQQESMTHLSEAMQLQPDLFTKVDK